MAFIIVLCVDSKIRVGDTSHSTHSHFTFDTSQLIVGVKKSALRYGLNVWFHTAKRMATIVTFPVENSSILESVSFPFG